MSKPDKRLYVVASSGYNVDDITHMTERYSFDDLAKDPDVCIGWEAARAMMGVRRVVHVATLEERLSRARGWPEPPKEPPEGCWP